MKTTARRFVSSKSISKQMPACASGSDKIVHPDRLTDHLRLPARNTIQKFFGKFWRLVLHLLIIVFSCQME
jgi:hypothetical protein